ncbi:hypothetical protein [Alteromonas sp. KUL49]|uniref:hypothetical protein n=1 Tax=Alteromonas sp. KUL49 TaxID=2480798 RepID=UPI00102F133A|nr:hypothetical protein [Alteromonas sp. KUL49]TAP33576.1 hypothetical protein EYS00_20100 [Alteromonas sp. KUL49]
MKALILLFALLLTACSTTYPNQNILNQNFPSVTGTSLSGDTLNIPQDMEGQPTLFLIGYKQDSQFDIDRWLIGLDMTGTQVDVYELPTIAGMFPRMFSTQIDNGMRKGIPKALWQGVVTIYEDGSKVQQFTGNEFPNNARVVLIDGAGSIKYFYDRGFSVAALNAMREELSNLTTE